MSAKLNVTTAAPHAACSSLVPERVRTVNCAEFMSTFKVSSQVSWYLVRVLTRLKGGKVRVRLVQEASASLPSCAFNRNAHAPTHVASMCILLTLRVQQSRVEDACGRCAQRIATMANAPMATFHITAKEISGSPEQRASRLRNVHSWYKRASAYQPAVN